MGSFGMLFDAERVNAMKLTPEQERQLAWDVRGAEQKAREAIAGIEVAEAILMGRSLRAERTRAAALERLEKAVAACEEPAKTDPELRRAWLSAKKHLAYAEECLWTLAMSGKRVAYGEARKLQSPLMSEEDLAQEGIIGLMRAARRFDPDRGIRFATYARWWVRAQMTRALETSGRTVRVPGGAVEQARNLREAAGRFEREGIEYTIEDLANEVGIEPERAEFLMSQGNVVSMDEPSEDGGTLGERIPSDDEGNKPDEQAEDKEILDRINNAMSTKLDERERFVIEHHYGLLSGDSQTMAEIGKNIGLSRERVRQIEAAALNRLRGLVI